MFHLLFDLLRRSLLPSLLAIIAFLAPIAARAAVGSWDVPGLDRWFHQGDSAPGLKADMATFADYGVGASFSQARSGSFMLGFDTSDQIPLVAPNRYQITSIKFTMDYVHDGRTVTYDATADSLSSILGGTDDPGRPIELYGVGYDNGYEKLGFGINDSLPPEFEEEGVLWPNGVPTLQQTFNVYPLGDDGTGNFGNIFNSPGGEGTFTYNEVEEEFELVEVTKEAWNTTPWAIGTTTAVPVGQRIPEGARFTFDVNLSLPGVLEYFQQALAEGQVATFISSLHDVSGFHNGGLSDSYPAFHSKESPWVEYDLALPPALEINYTLLAESIQGDFDDDGDVDGDDLSDWQAGYAVSELGDADGDGDTDGRDFLIWQRNYTGPGAIVSVIAVPEASSLLVVIFVIITGLTCRISPCPSVR